ncbi:MAG TPA: phosphoglycerate dehydrogenase, partial [Caulobacteraceae bacterium]|nr:phosphoglycerate dehydrogenase [Caulobacteraceae bacterium]
MAPRVLIADKLSPAAVAVFTNRGVDADVRTGLSKDQLLEIIGDYDGLALRSATKADKDVIAAGKALKVIGRAGIGVDNVDIPAATASGVVVMNTPFGNSITTAEHAIAMMFALARQLPQADLSTQAGKWEKNRFMGVELTAKTLGLIGCGNIGSIVAERANGLKMKVVAYDPFLSPERAVELGVEKVELDELLARADVITLHTPMTEKTRNILSAENLAKAKRGVFIVNCARGGLVDEAALRAGLDSGQIGGAAFDVFVEEPAKENVLFGAPNFVATPHLGASTVEAQENVALQVAEQMSDYLLTGAVTNALNSPSVTADEAPKLKPLAALAEKLGALAGQMVDVGVKAIDIAYEGEVASLNVKPLTAAALAGFLRPMLQDVNMVSAPAVAKERGIVISESRQEESPVFESLMRLTITTELGKRSFAGTLVGGAPRVVEVKGMELDAPFLPAMLYVNNLDKPGFIGALGALLGGEGIN